jgi:hypothetical protein
MESGRPDELHMRYLLAATTIHGGRPNAPPIEPGAGGGKTFLQAAYLRTISLRNTTVEPIRSQ